MEQKLFTNRETNKLIIFFAGWSCHPNQFVNLNFADHDLLIIYDYHNTDLQPFDFSKYQKHTIIAWSFGVWAAESVMHLLPENAKRIAINGTPTPIHNTDGIPEKIFNLTLKSIESGGIDKFNERMCADQIPDFIKSARSFESQFSELSVLNTLIKASSPQNTKWDYAIIGANDKIFPQKNMLHYWDKKSNFAPITLNIPHYPFTPECKVKLTELINFDR